MDTRYSFRDMEGQRVVITGGLGFIGSNIAHKVTDLGADAIILDACLDPYGWNFANIKEIRDKVTFVKGDIRDLEVVRDSVKECDVVFDCASQISHTISVKEPFLDIDINCKGALTVLEAVRESPSDPRVVYAGTRGEIGRMVHSPIDEGHPTNPIDMNGINKLAAEKYHLLYNHLYGIRTSSVRINNAYGIRSQMRHGDYGIVNWFIRKAMEDEQITINGDGSQTRDYSYVEDVVDAMVLVAQETQCIGEVFMLGTGVETPFIDMVRMILDACGASKDVRTRPWPKERKAIEIGNFCVSYEKLNKYTGWHPTIDNRKGLEKTVAFYRERKDEYF